MTHATLEYRYVGTGEFDYAVPKKTVPRKKQPPLIVVMNENCTACSGSPACMNECPVDCIHMMYEAGRPVRVYVENDRCIGCMNCLSDEVRPKNVIKGDARENAERINRMDLATKKGVCPWDAIDVHPFAEGAERSARFYKQPREEASADDADASESA